MNRYFWILAGSILCASGAVNASATDETIETTSLNEEMEIANSETEATEVAQTEETTESTNVLKLSEVFGHLIGRNLDNPGISFDLESVIKGMRDAAAGAESPMSEQEYEEAIAAIQENAFLEMAQKNLAEANAFMESNSIDEEIVELEAGKLQYKQIATGNGTEVMEHSVPTIRYTGTYADGTLFGSSDETGGPVTLPLDQTIPGFQKALVGMKEGEKRRIYIHPELGYGTSGHLPPNSLLVFDVEIVNSGNAANSAEEPIADIDADVEDGSAG